MLTLWIVLLLAVWLLGFFSLWRIPTCPPAASATFPTVSVVIPARDEAHNLPRLLASLRAQSLRPEQILVVDDHSEDDTAAIAAAGGGQVLRSPPLPCGWLGKPWACWQGAQRAIGELLVFLDADTQLEPDGLKRLVSTWVQRRGLVSVWPFHRMRRAYERLSAFFHIVIMASMRAFTPLGPRLAPLGAFGPCVACARRDYLQLGGHRSVRGEILEDIGLGRRFQQAGHRVHCLGGRGTIAFRMYPQGLPSLAAGFGKGMAAGARLSAAVVLIPLVLWIAAGFIVGFFLARSLVVGPAPDWPVWLGLYLLYALQLAWMLQRIGNYGPATALLYPVPALFFAAVFALSLASTYLLRRVRWKGRSISTRSNP
jgi:4,4'-diaponeurosporenoate glycosyltransferase